MAIVGFICFVVIIDNVIYPSYLSTVDACYPELHVLENTGYEVTGLTSFNYSTNETTVNIFYNDSIVIKHEQCHVNQIKEHRMYNCNYIVLHFFNEIECYIKHNF